VTDDRAVNGSGRAVSANLELGLVGNCTFNALIDSEGTVVWCCMPRPCATPGFRA